MCCAVTLGSFVVVQVGGERVACSRGQSKRGGRGFVLYRCSCSYPKPFRPLDSAFLFETEHPFLVLYYCRTTVVGALTAVASDGQHVAYSIQLPLCCGLEMTVFAAGHPETQAKRAMMFSLSNRHEARGETRERGNHDKGQTKQAAKMNPRHAIIAKRLALLSPPIIAQRK